MRNASTPRTSAKRKGDRQCGRTGGGQGTGAFSRSGRASPHPCRRVGSDCGGSCRNRFIFLLGCDDEGRDYCIPEFVEDSLPGDRTGQASGGGSSTKKESLGLAPMPRFPMIVPRRRRKSDLPDYRSQYGRKINLYPPSRTDYPDGPGRFCSAQEKLPARFGRLAFSRVGVVDELARGNSPRWK